MWYEDENRERNDNYPVANVSPHDIQKYIEWFNNKTGENFRLPTVEEWILAINNKPQDNEDFIYRRETNPKDENIRDFVRSLYEFSSTSCKNGFVLLAGDYKTDIEYLGQLKCESTLDSQITFRLVKEVE